VSSTSWTPDEDFSILLAAIDEYERIIEERKDHSFPHIIFVITGAVFALRSSLFALRSSPFALRPSLFALRSSLFARVR
jgi:hypothetical protein